MSTRIFGWNPKPAARLALARLYDDYAFTGLLDPERESSYRALALDAYRAYLDVRADDVGVLLSVGRLMLRERRFADAIEWLERAFRSGMPSSKEAVWYMECLFHLGRFGELREMAHRFHPDRQDDDPRLPDAVVDALSLWAGTGPLSEAGAS